MATLGTEEAAKREQKDLGLNWGHPNVYPSVSQDNLPFPGLSVRIKWDATYDTPSTEVTQN